MESCHWSVSIDNNNNNPTVATTDTLAKNMWSSVAHNSPLPTSLSAQK